MRECRGSISEYCTTIKSACLRPACRKNPGEVHVGSDGRTQSSKGRFRNRQSARPDGNIAPSLGGTATGNRPLENLSRTIAARNVVKLVRIPGREAPLGSTMIHLRFVRGNPLKICSCGIRNTERHCSKRDEKQCRGIVPESLPKLYLPPVFNNIGGCYPQGNCDSTFLCCTQLGSFWPRLFAFSIRVGAFGSKFGAPPATRVFEPKHPRHRPSVGRGYLSALRRPTIRWKSRL